MVSMTQEKKPLGLPSAGEPFIWRCWNKQARDGKPPAARAMTVSAWPPGPPGDLKSPIFEFSKSEPPISGIQTWNISFIRFPGGLSG